MNNKIKWLEGLYLINEKSSFELHYEETICWNLGDDHLKKFDGNDDFKDFTDDDYNKLCFSGDGNLILLHVESFINREISYYSFKSKNGGISFRRILNWLKIIGSPYGYEDYNRDSSFNGYYFEGFRNIGNNNMFIPIFGT